MLLDTEIAEHVASFTILLILITSLLAKFQPL
jgi:hypothetical protein